MSLPRPSTVTDLPEQDASGSASGPSAARRAERDSQGTSDGALEAAFDGPADHDLIRRAQTGEEEAFRLLVERHQDRALRVAANLVGHGEDARDLAQEAFLRVFRSLERFDFQHEFTTWLYRIVTNLGIDFLRRKRPAVRMSAVGEDDEELELEDERVEAPSAALERDETGAKVRACIERLAPHFRTVMTLRELEGLSCLEIADIVGATHVTVRWRLHRGRKLFQEEWERMERAGRSGAQAVASTESGTPQEDSAGHPRGGANAEDARP